MGEILKEVFWWGKPGFPILVVAGMSCGVWFLREIMEAVGDSSKNIMLLNRLIAASIVMGSAWMIFDSIFGRLLGK